MKTIKNQSSNKAPMYPEVLPWFARRAGISDDRAKVLWDLTCRDVCESDPGIEAKARLHRFIERIGEEAGLPVTPDYTAQPDQFAWHTRHVARLADMNLVAGGAVARLWHGIFNKLGTLKYQTRADLSGA